MHLFTCTDCNHSVSLSSTPRRYMFTDGSSATIRQAPGWCYTCGGLRWVESIKPLEALQIHLSEVHHTNNGAGIVPPGTLTDYIRDVEIRVLWREGRESPPRCLECGSTHISAANLHDGLWSLRHPECSGTLQQALTPKELTVRTILDYTPEGERLNGR